jgi:hypothetical protein
VKTLSALALNWALTLAVVLEIRRELSDPSGGRARRSRTETQLLYAVLAVLVTAAVVLTALRLHSGG